MHHILLLNSPQIHRPMPIKTVTQLLHNRNMPVTFARYNVFGLAKLFKVNRLIERAVFFRSLKK